MTSLDVSQLSPNDAIAALRSYSRRYRAALLPMPTDPVAEEWPFRVGPDGHSAIELVVNTVNSWVLLQRALQQVLVDLGPTLHPAVLDHAEREWAVEPDATARDVLDRLDAESAALVAAIERIHGKEWTRTGTVAGGGSVTALDLVRDAVATGADNLRAADATMTAVRRS